MAQSVAHLVTTGHDMPGQSVVQNQSKSAAMRVLGSYFDLSCNRVDCLTVSLTRRLSLVRSQNRPFQEADLQPIGGCGSFSAVVVWPVLRLQSTPFPLSEVLLERAMRLNTDGKQAVLGKSMGIEIGGAHDGRNST